MSFRPDNWDNPYQTDYDPEFYDVAFLDSNPLMPAYLFCSHALGYQTRNASPEDN